MPGDPLGNFGSALEQLSQRSTYFYEENGHYWFDTQPSVAKTASDYVERLREDTEVVWNEVVSRLQKLAKPNGSFQRVYAAPEGSSDIPDQETTALVIVHPKYAFSRKGGVSDAESLNLSAQQARQATANKKRFDDSVNDKIRTAYCHILYPDMDDATQPFTIEHEKMNSGGSTLVEGWRISSNSVRCWSPSSGLRLWG